MNLDRPTHEEPWEYWKTEAERLHSELAQVREALRPFAEQATVFDDIPGVYRCCDDVELWQKTGWRIPITVGQLRQARAALIPHEKPEGR